ncbi:MAG: CatB-related O-acetyltransferase [Flavisolibacter sp.]|nr:CatB-related O-acetyltransferase [Flavisolibacter sp.]
MEIGSYCSIANDVNFILDDGFHLSSEVTTFPLFNHLSDPSLTINNQTIFNFKDSLQPAKRNIKIGNDVWIGMNAIILPGIKVGNGVTVMAGAVVSSDIPDYAVVGGVPAKIVKMKHVSSIISDLLEISWWNWNPKKVEENTADFYLPINEFIAKWR